MSYTNAPVCNNYCTGMQQMSIWCNDDACQLGTGNAGFECECVTNGWAVAGIVIGAVVVVVGLTICCIVYCIIKQRRRQQLMVNAQAANGPVYTYNANPYAQPTQQVVIVGIPQQQPYPQQPYQHHQQQQQQQYYGTASPAGYGAPPSEPLQERFLHQEPNSQAVPPYVQAQQSPAAADGQGYYYPGPN